MPTDPQDKNGDYVYGNPSDKVTIQRKHTKTMRMEFSFADSGARYYNLYVGSRLVAPHIARKDAEMITERFNAPIITK